MRPEGPSVPLVQVLTLYTKPLYCPSLAISPPRARPGWTGSAKDFIAAGDGVLKRLRHHMKDGMHLYAARREECVAMLFFFFLRGVI